MKTTGTAKIEHDKKSDFVTSAAPELPKMMKPIQELSAALKAEPSKKQEPILVPTRKHEPSPGLLEVQKADRFKIPKLTPDSKELVEVHLAKTTEPTPLSSEIKKPEPSRKSELPSTSKTEPVIKEGPKIVCPESPKVEPELTQSPPQLPMAKPIQEKEQISLPKKKSPPKRGIITKIFNIVFNS